MQGKDQVDSLIRKLPCLQINNHFKVETDALGNKLLHAWNFHIIIAGREGVPWCKVKFAELGVGEAVHLPAG